MKIGKLIVLEGTDGSGKGTQFTLLCDYLQTHQIPFETMDFPRYNASFFGDVAGRMLAGEFGQHLPPELAVLPFACDRWLLKDDLTRWLSEGKLVVSNRYTASSAVYHAAKLPKEKQYPFIEWLYRMEQEVIGLPHEDIALYLHVPAARSRQLAAGRGKQDMYELDSAMQESVERLYLELATHRSGWKTVACVQGDAMRSKESIHKDIVDVLTVNGVV